MASPRLSNLGFIFLLTLSIFDPFVVGLSNPLPNETFSEISLTELDNSFNTVYFEDVNSPVEPAPTENGSPFVCRFSELTPQENANILDFVKKGEKLDSFNGSANPDVNEKLGNDTALVPDAKGEVALKQKFPNQLFSPDQASFLKDRQGVGAFAFGIVVQDTLRVGRCEGLQKSPAALSNTSNPFLPSTGSPSTTTVPDGIKTTPTVLTGQTCWLETPGLQYPNDDKGYAPKVVNATKNLFEWRNDPQLSKYYNQTLGEDTVKLLQDTAAVEAGKDSFDQVTPEDNVNIPAQVLERVPSSVSNRWQATNFIAKMQTPCGNSECSIEVYSLFGKYFNSTASLGLVISNFGPTLWGEAGKLFGKLGKNKIWPWKGSYDELKKSISSDLYGLKTPFTAARTARWQETYRKHPPFKDFFYTLGGDQPALFGANDSKMLAELRPGGKTYQYLQENFESRRAFSRAIADTKANVKLGEMARDIAKKDLDAALAAAGDDVAAKTAANTQYQQRFFKIMGGFDNPNPPGIDIAEYVLKNPEFGLSDAWYFNESTKSYQLLSSTNSGGNLMKEWGNGAVDFTEFGAKNSIATEAGKVKLFKPDISATTQTTISGLEGYVKNEPGKWFISINGVNTPLTEDALKNLPDAVNGFYTIFKSPNVFKPYTTQNGELFNLGADDIAKRFGERSFLDTRFGNMSRNMDAIESLLAEQKLTGRSYLSLLDQQAAQENNLIGRYFGFVDGKPDILGPVKWTALPFLYSYVKRGGGINPNLSLYQLPKTYNELQIQNGTDPIYSDAYIDFFANASSDQGDIFLAFINSLPYKQFVLDPIAENWAPAKALVDKVSGNPTRAKVEDVAVLLYSPKTCSTCSTSLQSEGVGSSANFSFKSGEKLTSFLFEHPTSDKAKVAGSLLISYAHHADLKTTSGEGEPVNIAQAIREDKSGTPTTCGAKTKNFFKLASLTPQQVGALLTVGETVGYVAFGGTLGIFGSLTQQVYIAPQFQDCRDVEGGYFIHYLVSNPTNKDSSKTAQQLGSEKAAKLVDNAQQGLSSLLAGERTTASTDAVANNNVNTAGTQSVSTPALEQNPGGAGVIPNALNQIAETTDKLTAKVQQDKILQATVLTTGQSNGHLNGNRLFWAWLSGENDLNPTEYNTTNVTNLSTASGSQVQIDNATGKITYKDANTGQTVTLVNQPDHTRLTSHNLTVPAEEIPARLNAIGLPNTATPMIDVDAAGRSEVLDARVADCFRQASLKQTGVELNPYGSKSGDLTAAFGRVTDVFTTLGKASPQETKIVMEGTTLSFNADSPSAKIRILGNRDTNITGAGDKAIPVGKMKSIQFENGLVVYKPETNELLVWIKHHGQAILAEKDVAGLKAKLTTTTNPNTQCAEPAIDLKAIAAPNSPESQRKVENFNEGMGLNGPFQVFETTDKTFILYSDKDCTPHFKVIDKKTGQVYDQAIKNITQTDKGVIIETVDGQTHDLEFKTENGKPILSYNGKDSTLLSAQGKSGSFYFDPEKGLYYAENGQFLPLNDAFKQQGLSVQADADGKVNGTPGINIFNAGTQGGGQGNGLFNLPSIPDNALLIALLSIFILVGFYWCFERQQKH